MFKKLLNISFVWISSTTICLTAAGNVIKNGSSYKFWNLKSISGLLSLEANYRRGSYYLPDRISDERSSTFFSGEAELNTNSFIWHPSFFRIEADFGYRPFRNLDLYVISPDHSEINTTERINLNGIFFENKIFSINPFYNFIHSYSRREYTTNLETYSNNYGVRFISPNSFLPSNLSVSQNNWEQSEIETDRFFSTDQFTIAFETNKSFGEFNRNRFNADYNDYTRVYTPSSRVRNKATNWNLTNDFLLSPENQTIFNSRISSTNQTGDQPLNRFLLSENFRSDLPSNFGIRFNYQFYRLIQYSIESNQNTAEIELKHRLFKSLESHLLYNYTNIVQSYYKQLIKRIEFGFNYKKNIPFGILRLHYSYGLRNEERENNAGFINILEERKILTDGTAALLDNPFVDRNSIVVTNLNGTVIYQENFDYIIIQRDVYFEIQRVPGGQIPNGSTVLISYQAEQQPSFTYSTKSNSYGIGFSLFDNSVDIYFNAFDQNYSNADLVELKYLKTIRQKIAGIRFNYSLLYLGAEYENYHSNITPYNSMRFYARMYNLNTGRFIFSSAANYRIYYLVDDDLNQKFGDVSLLVAYMASSKSKITAEGSYVIQSGRQIDLNLAKLKVEYSAYLRKIELSVGYEFYDRRLLEEHTYFSGIYAKVTRRF